MSECKHVWKLEAYEDTDSDTPIVYLTCVSNDECAIEEITGMKAISAYINQLEDKLEQARKFVSVDDQLPEEEGQYLCKKLNSDGVVFFVVARWIHWNKYKHMKKTNGFWHLNQIKVTHFCPQPLKEQPND